MFRLFRHYLNSEQSQMCSIQPCPRGKILGQGCALGTITFHPDTVDEYGRQMPIHSLTSNRSRSLSVCHMAINSSYTTPHPRHDSLYRGSPNRPSNLATVFTLPLFSPTFQIAPPKVASDGGRDAAIRTNSDNSFGFVVYARSKYSNWKSIGSGRLS